MRGSTDGKTRSRGSSIAARVFASALLASALLALGHEGLACRTVAAQGSTEAGVRFVDVGQGSSLVAWDGTGHVVAIDSGPAAGAEAVLAALIELEGISPTVDLWVHTHHDADHVGGLLRVRAGVDGALGTGDDVEIGEAWDRGTVQVADTPSTRAYFAAVGDVRRRAVADDTWASGALRVAVLETGVDAVAETPENRRGLAVCLEVGALRVFVPGDLPVDAQLVALSDCPQPDVVWASHHGAADGVSAALVEAVGPGALVVVSAGRDNAHCHPAPATLSAWWAHELVTLHTATARRSGSCGAMVDAMGPRHRVAGKDLVVSAPAA